MGNKERVAYALLFGDRFILRYYFFFLSRLDEYYIPLSNQSLQKDFYTQGSE